MPKTRKRRSYAVWEITLKCNLACSHCGSRAGDARVDELTTEEALDLVHQLADAGVGEVTLIGGEAFLRADWLDIAAEIHKCGMVCTLTTGGYGISRQVAERMKESIAQVSVSVDGLQETHDKLRGVPGSWNHCFTTMGHLKAVGIPFGCNTQINRLSAPELPMLYEKLKETGFVAWQLQLTVPMGNAADQAEILMQPSELLELYPMLAAVCVRCNSDGIAAMPGNNIGYYGPYERIWRNEGPYAFWQGCQAGLHALGIEADGKIKGCPSLPTTAYTGGNIRDMNLKEIILDTPELGFNLGAGTDKGTDHLWGFCKGCQFAEICRGGCSWTAHVFFDKRGNNPYCHHRALVQAARGLREHTKLKRAASGEPFDNGEFDLWTEPIDAPWPEDDPLRFTWDKIQWPADWPERDRKRPEKLPYHAAGTIERLGQVAMPLET